MGVVRHVHTAGQIKPSGQLDCRIDQCTKPARKRGMCEMHYSRVQRHGDPFTVKRFATYPPDAQCNVPGCTRRPTARGWCDQHYRALHTPAQPRPRAKPYRGALCTIDGCAKPAYCLDLCGMHYQRQVRHGDPHITLRPGSYHGALCIDGCDMPAVVGGRCRHHYHRARVNA